MNELQEKRDITLTPRRIVNLKLRATVLAIQEKIQSMPESLGKDPFPLKHSFADGLYIRKIFIPRGMLVVGSLHRDSYLNVILSGDISVMTEEGIKRVVGPTEIVSPAGNKRFGYSHEDTVWITVHKNPENITDIDVLEDMILIDDYEDVSEKVVDIDATFEKFIGEVAYEGFDVEFFRRLTLEVFSREKPGFWSDWTEEQQKKYMSGDWEDFSRSRGYSEEEIEMCGEWIALREYAEKIDLNPFDMIRDITLDFALKNIEADKKGEIMLSSHIPTSKKTPYK